MKHKQPLYDGIPLTDQQRLLWIYESLTQKNPNLEILKSDLIGQYSPLVELIEMQLQEHHKRGKLILPNLGVWGNKSIAIFSDYSGESSGNYHTYTFLICAMDTLGFFHQEMQKLRKQSALADHEIAFKRFREASQRNNLSKYLKLLDQYVPGLLFTVAIEKKLLSVMGSPTKECQIEIAKMLETAGFGTLKPVIAEKLSRVVSIAAYLTALFAKSGQKIFWMTDHDAICEDGKHGNMLSFFQSALPLYTDADFPLIGGARPFKEKSMDYLDLLSATDVVSSSLEHYLTNRDTMGEENVTVKEGADKILYWLGQQGLGLKKLNLLIYQGKDNEYNVGTIDITQTSNSYLDS